MKKTMLIAVMLMSSIVTVYSHLPSAQSEEESSKIEKLFIIGDGSDDGDLSIFLIGEVNNSSIENVEIKIISLLYIYSLKYINAEDISIENSIVFNKTEEEDLWLMTKSMPNYTFNIIVSTEVKIKITRKSMIGERLLLDKSISIDDFNSLFSVEDYF